MQISDLVPMWGAPADEPVEPESFDPLEDQPAAGEMGVQDERPDLEDEPVEIDPEQWLAQMGGAGVQVLSDVSSSVPRGSE